MIGRLRSLLFCAAAAVAISASAAEAQQTPRSSAPSPAVREAPAGPTRDAARVAFGTQQQQAVLDVEAMRLQQRQGAGFGHAEALMIVGGAAFVAGLIIGGDAGTIVMLGGAGVGLYGLYLYLQ